MALNILSIYTMLADLERIFLGSRRMVTWERARLGIPSVKRNECLKSWSKGGLIDTTIIPLDNSSIKAQNESLLDLFHVL